jgi:peptide/nickel transport system substrate-binding protein
MQMIPGEHWRKSLTGVLGGPAYPIFWNIDKSE